MKRVYWVLLFCGLACLSVLSPAFAKWSEPVLLSELNDLQNQFPAAEPAVSSDGLTVYFARRVVGTTSPMYVFEARRENRDGLFQTPKPLTELGTNGDYVEKPWISLDGKRLYFAEIMKYQGLWHRFIRVSSRASVDQPWSPATSITDIHKFYNESVDSLPALTGDELTIFWFSNSSADLQSRKLYTAVRRSLKDPFIAVREVMDFDQVKANALHLSPDGLTVYFTAPNPKSGVPNIWKGIRAARDGVFSEFAIVSDLCDDVRRASSPYLTPDGKTIFFTAKRGTDLATNWGVWESHWVQDPLDEARQNLQQALVTKQAVRNQIDTTLDLEWRAIDMMMFMWKNGGYGGLTQDQIYQAYYQASLGISRQLLARRFLDQSILALQNALGWLTLKP